MAGVTSRESYFEAGLDVLSDSGYGELKLAVVCGRLGVTTGSFYHYFPSWSAYTKDLLDHWLAERNRGMATAYAEPDPRRRIGALIDNALLLPHGAEAAIRVWSSIEPEVYAVQAAVDGQRFDALFDAAMEILRHQRQARVFASWGMYVLIGYEQSTIPRDAADLRWIADQLLDTLDSGRFGSVPDTD